ncbi:MAG: hypothetical protein PHN31_06860, partial [Candidatus Gracilibacteria bacterium]|nr:hypothetical protein [Candidatus Gracilibacteria bacterium]
MTSKLNKEILDKINKEDLKPISKSYFSWKNKGFWFGLTITLVLIGIIFSFCVNDAFDVRETMMMGHNYGSFFFYIPVLFWITIIGLFIYLGIIEFRKTKYGYKTSLAILTTYIIIISLVLGTVFIYYPYSRQIHRSMVDNMPFLTQYIYNESARDSPENGRLIGTIKEVDSEKIV